MLYWCLYNILKKKLFLSFYRNITILCANILCVTWALEKPFNTYLTSIFPNVWSTDHWIDNVRWSIITINVLTVFIRESPNFSNEEFLRFLTSFWKKYMYGWNPRKCLVSGIENDLFKICFKNQLIFLISDKTLSPEDLRPHPAILSFFGCSSVSRMQMGLISGVTVLLEQLSRVRMATSLALIIKCDSHW